MGRVYVRGAGRVRLGARVTLDAREAPIELHALEGAEIVIGDDVVICGGTSIEAQDSVSIGSRVRIERFCKVIDNHFHQVHGSRTVRPKSKPVVVEDDVTLGARVIVLSGAVVGSGSMIHPSSVISRRVPAGSEMMGVPAMAVRRLAAE